MVKMVKIATWNVNSVKSRCTQLVDYLKSPQAPDILCLQELKCETDNFPHLEIGGTGYNYTVHGQKTYNGVAILSKYPIDEVNTTLPGRDIDQNQARYMEVVISLKNEALRIVNLYIPNGQSIDSDKFTYKKLFYDRLYEHTKQLLSYNEKLVLAGDFNVAPNPIDVYDPARLEGTICFHPEERTKIRSLIGLGLTDAYRAIHPDTKAFSWWDYREAAWQKNHGLRIDYLLLSPEAADCVVEAGIESKMRNNEKPSDHAPVWCSLKT
jgi:exodeoxyribonuclease III